MGILWEACHCLSAHDSKQVFTRKTHGWRQQRTHQNRALCGRKTKKTLYNILFIHSNAIYFEDQQKCIIIMSVDVCVLVIISLFKKDTHNCKLTHDLQEREWIEGWCIETPSTWVPLATGRYRPVGLYGASFYIVSKKHTRSPTHKHEQKHTHNTQTQNHMHIHTQTHTQLHKHTHPQTRTQKHKHNHKHTSTNHSHLPTHIHRFLWMVCRMSCFFACVCALPPLSVWFNKRNLASTPPWPPLN